MSKMNITCFKCCLYMCFYYLFLVPYIITASGHGQKGR